jgi:hypothetical protein
MGSRTLDRKARAIAEARFGTRRVGGPAHCASAALAAALVASFFGLMDAARAQGEEELIDEANANRAKEVQVVRVWQLAIQQNIWSAFGNEFGTMNEARDKLNAILTERIEEVERSCPLTEPQRKKLLVAGKGEIKRFLDRLDALRPRYENGAVEIGDSHGGDSIHNLQTERRGLLSDGSLFGKTLARTLSQEQFVRYKTDRLNRSRFPYGEAVYQAARKLQTSLSLSMDQRQRLEKLLLEETRAPKKIGRNSVYSLVIFQASRIPEARLKPIFTEAQWQLVNQQMAAWRWGNGEALFEESGYVFADKPAETRPIGAIPGSLRRGFNGR